MCATCAAVDHHMSPGQMPVVSHQMLLHGSVLDVLDFQRLDTDMDRCLQTLRKVWFDRSGNASTLGTLILRCLRRALRLAIW